MDFTDFSNVHNLPWLVPLGPLLAFIIISLATNRAKMQPSGDLVYGGFQPPYSNMPVPVATQRSRILSIIVGMSGVVMALLASWNLVFQAIGTEHFGEGEAYFHSAIQWLASGIYPLEVGVLVDPLTAIMLFMVPLAVLCIFIYSIGYMANDPRQSRFFALISLFAGAMLTLVVSDNLLFLFVGWEVMGVCSYLLIGFWFEKETAYKAAIKAFTTTRVADVVMLLGIAYLYYITSTITGPDGALLLPGGSLNFRDILYNQAVLQAIAGTPALIFGAAGFSAAGLIGTFLVIGTIGKSAQFPLHVWLPDAMEGPTPVSAMIHAAAMVSAGIYAIIRMYPLFVGAADPHHGIFSQPLLLMAIVGAFTAIFAATMAVAQNDVKAVLAYSTISQLGFMMAALGIGAYVAAAFHLITHAFFKALLFMASGSVIHAMEHGEHHVHEHAHGHGHGHDEHANVSHHADDHAHDEHGHGHDAAPAAPRFDPQDMRNMGGLKDRIPVTFYAFLAGGMSLAGFPLITAGFWSKDEILADAWNGAFEGSGVHAFVFFLLAVAAFMTAFYTMRQIGLTFMGEARTEEAKHAGLGGPENIISQTMQLPLLILIPFALLAGFVGVPSDFFILGGIFSPAHNPFHHFVQGTLIADLHTVAPPFDRLVPIITSLVVALGGIFVGYRMYWVKPLKAGEVDPMVSVLGDNLYTTLQKRYYFDDLYTALFVRPSQWISLQVNEFVDKGIIDGILHTIARVFTWLGDLVKMLNTWLIDGVGDGVPRGIYQFGGWLRGSQSGRIQQYLLAVLIAAVLIGIVFALASGAVIAG